MNKDLVRFILERATDHEWSLQGFGMLRLYISDSIRLHVWDSRYRVPNVSSIHTHPWDFESTVVVGSITDVTYSLSRCICGSVCQNNTHVLSRILCGHGASLAGERESCIAKEMQHKTFNGGEQYSHTWGDLHESRPVDGTVTIVKRSFRADRDHAFVVWRAGSGWVSAEPRKATLSEVKDITTTSLERWFK